MHILHSSEIPESYLGQLAERLGPDSMIPLKSSPDVYKSVASHPDVFFFMLDRHTLIYSASVMEDTLSLIRKAGIRLISSGHTPFGAYPSTARLNAVRVGGRIIHNIKFTDDTIVEEVEKSGLKLFHVNQGYARCSVVPVAANALISSDEGIAEQTRRAGFDVLKISAGNIKLPGEEYGFIGGSCGTMPEGTIVFLGDIELHPDSVRIKEFLAKYGVRFIRLDGLPLYDGGGLFFL